MSDQTEALAARITELEIKLSFAEDALESLDAIVIRQQQEVAALAKALCELGQQVRSGQPAEARSLRDEIPPHY